MDEKLQKLISLRIKNLREELGLTQEAFSEKIGVEISTISKIENGKTFPSFSTVCTIVYEFNLEPNYFLDFIKYQNDKNKLLDSLIVEHLHNVSDKTKLKFLELLETL